MLSKRLILNYSIKKSRSHNHIICQCKYTIFFETSPKKL